MKKYGFLATLAAVAIAGVVGWNLLRGRDDSMASSIPADATMVGRVDLKTLLLDYGLDFADLKDLLLSGKEGDETGLKYQTAAYFFASQGYFGAVAALSDEDDFEAFLKKQGNYIEEQRGLKWGTTDNNMLYAFNDDRVVLMGPAVGSEQDALRNTIYNCIRQKASDSGKQGRIYELLDARKEAIAVATNFDALPKELQTIGGNVKHPNLIVDLGELDITAGFSASKEMFSLNLGLSSQDAQLNKMLDKLDDTFDKIDGSLASAIPTNAFCHAEMGLDGKALLEMLRSNKGLRIILMTINMVIDFDKILKNIDGDVALTWLDSSLKTPNLLFQAQLDDDDFMKNVSDWNDASTRAMGLNFYSQNKHNAVCTFSGTPIYFGTHNKLLSISNIEGLVKAEAHHDALPKFSDEVKGNRLYATVFINQIRPLLGTVSPGVDEYLDKFDRLTLRIPRSRDIRLELTTREGVDILKELITKVQQQ